MLFLAALRSPLEAQAWVDGPAAYYTVYQEGALADLRLSYTLSVSAWELLGDGSLVTPEAAAAPITGSRVNTAAFVNALRKEVDRRQIEFVKSGKLKPVAFSSRHYDFKREKWVFGKASDDEIATFVERKVYWGTKLRSPLLAKDARNGAPPSDAPPAEKRVWIGDPTDAQYLETTPAHLLEIAGRLVAGDGLVRIDGEWAEATAGLMGRAERFEAQMRAAVEELEKKHAFERG